VAVGIPTASINSVAIAVMRIMANLRTGVFLSGSKGRDD
jgi:hypothetical protein